MFSTIYLRLEGKVPLPPPRIEIVLNMNTIDSLAFMSSLIYPPPPQHHTLPCLEYIHFPFITCTEKKTSVFQVQMEFWINMTFSFLAMYPPPPHP